MMRTIKLLLAAVAVMTVLCTGARAEVHIFPDDLLVWLDDRQEYFLVTSYLTAGEWVVSGDYETPPGLALVIEHDVTLRIPDGCSLIIDGGVMVTGSNSLTIEGGQDPATAGRLEVRSISAYTADAKIKINGGMVKAISKGSYPGIGPAGILTVNGGTLEARSEGGGHGIELESGLLMTNTGGCGWIVASSLSNKTNTSNFKGVIFDESTFGNTYINGALHEDCFLGKVYGSPTITHNVKFPDNPFRPGQSYYRGEWILTIPEGEKLVIAPGATLEMKSSGRGGDDLIDIKGTLEVNGVLRYNALSDLRNALINTENVTGSGVLENDNGAQSMPEYRYLRFLASNFNFYLRNGLRAYATTVEAGSAYIQGLKCTAWADPPYALPGTRIKLIPSPIPGYELDYWRGMKHDHSNPTGLPISNDEFTMPAEDVYIIAAFKKKDYAINVFSVDGGGTASVTKSRRQISAPDEIYDYEVDVTLTPRANAGYEFDGWAVLKPEGLVITDNKFTMPTSDVEIVAKFRKITHNIDVWSVTHIAAAMAAPERAASGDIVSLRAIPENGYRLAGWYAVDPRWLSIGEDGRFTMPNQAVKIQPTWSALPPSEHSITVQNDGHGTATASPTSAASGAQITLTPSPDPGYEFDRWAVLRPDQGVDISQNHTFTMPDTNVVVVPMFRKKVYDIKVDPGVHGSATPSRPSASSDDVITLMPEPIYGFMFASWDITEPEGLVITDGNQFNMPNSPVRVRPIFTPLPLGEHSIVVGSDGNGTGTPDPTAAFPGTEITLTPFANDGYVFDRWVVVEPSSGLDISDDKFEMPNTYVVVNAMFRKIPAAPTEHTITLHNVDGGGSARAIPNRAAAGTDITLTPFAKDGYDLDRWVVLDPAGLVISGNKFKMPDSDVSIVAVFKERETEQSPPQTPGQEQGTHDGAINVDKTDGLWSADAGRDLTIYIEYDFDQFTKIVSLDGAPLKMDTANVSRDFGARSGSTIVTIWERTLKEKIRTNGVHRAELGFKDGTVSVPFAAIVTRSDSHGGSSSGGSGGGGCATMGAAVVAVAAMAMIRHRTR